MRWYTIILLVILFVYGINAYSQESTSDTLVHGRYAIAFSFSGLNLGGGIGGKYWFNENYSLKVEININGSYMKTNYDLLVQPYNIECQKIDLSLTCGIARYFPFRNNLMPYVSGLIGFGWSDEWNSYTYTTGSQYDRYLNRIIILGVGLGVEYWITQNISLSGEQILRAEYWYNSEKSKKIIGRSGNSSLILSIYI